jgi:hypothetical protein
MWGRLPTCGGLPTRLVWHAVRGNAAETFMPRYDLDPSIEQLSQAIARLEAASGDAAWRAAAIEAAPLLARGAAALMETLSPPAAAGQAQRFARVKVAEILLYHADAVKAGRATADLYGALRAEIDAARGEFRERFLSAGGAAADDLHSELVRALANNDAALLGPKYPGPMA